MKVEQIYTGCLAQGAYYISSNGEAAIIDPLRETQPYLDKAAQDNVKVKYIFETHFHADFVSGHVDLAQKTGAAIVFGPGADTVYDSVSAVDNQVFAVGDVKIKVLHTPGHTLESVTYLLLDEQGKEYAIFTGDTLFIGDVGRPDLAVKSSLTEKDLAGLLYDSLHEKIMPLPEEVLVYPAHGAGSACGKNMSKETFDTLGNQKRTNYALQSELKKEDFIKELLSGLASPPQYFSENVRINKEGYESMDQVLKTGMVSLKVDEFENLANATGALILDTRNQQVFKEGFIPNSIFIGIDGGFAPWVGVLIKDLKQPILLIADEGREEEIITRLARVGYDNTIGFLKGGIESWLEAGKEVDMITSITPEELEDRLNGNAVDVLIDARKPSEYEAEHVDGAFNFPLDFVNENMSQLDRSKEYHIHCAGGYRSMILSSILKSRGFQKLVDVKKGFKGIKETNISTTEYVCPSTLK